MSINVQRLGRRRLAVKWIPGHFETSGNQSDPYLLQWYSICGIVGYDHPGEGDGVQGRQVGRQALLGNFSHEWDGLDAKQKAPWFGFLGFLKQPSSLMFQDSYFCAPYTYRHSYFSALLLQ